MLENFSMGTWLVLAVVLWVVYEAGKLAGARKSASAVQKNADLLFAAKQVAEEEAAQCRFAYALVMAALQEQEKRIAAAREELAMAEAEQATLRFKIVELETSIFERRATEGAEP